MYARHPVLVSKRAPRRARRLTPRFYLRCRSKRRAPLRLQRALAEDKEWRQENPEREGKNRLFAMQRFAPRRSARPRATRCHDRAVRLRRNEFARRLPVTSQPALQRRQNG